MNAVLRYIMIPLCLLILADRGLGLYLDHLYRRNCCNYNEGGLNEYLSQPAPDTLIIGSSRAIHMIIPDSLGKSSRILGQQQKNLYYHHAVLSILNDENKLPEKQLILNIELTDLFMERKQRLLQQVQSLSFFYHRNQTVQQYIDQIDRYEHFKHLSYLYRHNSNGLLLLTNPLQEICPGTGKKGYMPLYPGPLDSLRIYSGLAEDSLTYNFREINPGFLKCIREIRNICLKNNIELVLLNGPYFQPYAQMKIHAKTMSSLLKKAGINYIDFVGEPDSSLMKRELWYDHVHLNHEGAKLYSQKLRDRLKKSAAKNRGIVNQR